MRNMLGSVRTRIRFNWYNFSVPYKLNCTKCSKSFQRTLRTGCNHLGDRKEIAEQLKVDALKQQQAESKTAICAACIKAAASISTAKKTVNHKHQLKIVRAMKVARELNGVQSDLRKTFYGKLVTAPTGEEVEVTSVFFSFDGKFLLGGYAVNKRVPWETTRVYMNVPLDTAELLNQTLKDREPVL